MQMSTKKYASANLVFKTLISHWNLKGFSALANYLGVPYQTLMAWKKRDRIADLAPFMDKGISKNWLETGEGEMFVTPITGTSHERLQLGEHAVGTVGTDPDAHLLAAINQELSRMTRKQLAEVLSILVAKNEERSPHARG